MTLALFLGTSCAAIADSDLCAFSWDRWLDFDSESRLTTFSCAKSRPARHRSFAIVCAAATSLPHASEAVESEEVSVHAVLLVPSTLPKLRPPWTMLVSDGVCLHAICNEFDPGKIELRAGRLAHLSSVTSQSPEARAASPKAFIAF